MSTARPRPVATAHALLVDDAGRMLFAQTASGRWRLPATELASDVPPQHQIVRLARAGLGIEAAERDLLLAHVAAHPGSEQLRFALIFSIGAWQGVPGRGAATTCWSDPGEPPAPLSDWDRDVLPALLTTRLYTEIGWRRDARDAEPVAASARPPSRDSEPVRRRNPGSQRLFRPAAG